MYTYTTPTLPLTIKDVDFSQVSLFRVAIEQDDPDINGGLEMLKIIQANDPMVDAAHKTIMLPLTQQETASFEEGTAQVQIRIKFTGGAVLATNKATISINDVIDKVII